MFSQKAVFSFRLKLNVTKTVPYACIMHGINFLWNFVNARIVSGTQVFHRVQFHLNKYNIILPQSF